MALSSTLDVEQWSKLQKESADRVRYGPISKAIARRLRLELHRITQCQSASNHLNGSLSTNPQCPSASDGSLPTNSERHRQHKVCDQSTNKKHDGNSNRNRQHPSNSMDILSGHKQVRTVLFGVLRCSCTITGVFPHFQFILLSDFYLIAL